MRDKYGNKTHINFNIEFATMFGVDAALLLDHLQRYISYHKIKDTNFREGRHWTYNSIKQLIEEYFPFWTESQMRTIIRNLVKRGVIITSTKFNKMPGDKTTWFAFFDNDAFTKKCSSPFVKNDKCENTRVSEDKIEKNGLDTHLSKMTNGFVKNDEAIPTTISIERKKEERSENSKPVASVSCRNATPSLSEESKKVSKEKKARGSRLSPTWELPVADRDWALLRCIFNEHIDIQADKFKDHWISTTKNPLKLDWSATWRNWLRNAKDVHLKEPISNLIKGVSLAQAEQPPHRTCDDPKIKKWYDSKGMDIDSRMGTGTWVSWFERLEIEKFS